LGLALRVVSGSVGVGKLERLEALVANSALYELGDLVPETDRSLGGRPRLYPAFMWVLFDALLSVYGSARQVEAELAHPLVWNHLTKLVRTRFPNEPAMWLRGQPMRRHHYLYGRTRWLTRPSVLEAIHDLHRRLAVDQARSLGLLDPAGPGSWTHPDLSRMLYADGKVLTPLYRAHPGDTRLDKTTGELRPVRAEPDGGLHFEGTGETAWGTKWVHVAVRSPEVHGRVILDVDWVPSPGGEAATAMDSFTALAPLCPGAQGVIYDTALRGVHHQRLLRDLGLLSVNKVAAAKAGAKTPRRGDGKRVPKSTFVEQRSITLVDGTSSEIALFAQDGAIGTATLTDTGEQRFVELRRVRTHRNADKGGTYRWYNDYQLPPHLGGGNITVRLHGTADDAKRKFNRTENIRPIPATDPDFTRLYRRRNDAESINRALDDTLWLRRAHSVGHERQHLNLLSHALGVNSLALVRYQQRSSDPPALAA
jgi:hypothetical protein